MAESYWLQRTPRTGEALGLFLDWRWVEDQMIFGADYPQPWPVATLQVYKGGSCANRDT